MTLMEVSWDLGHRLYHLISGITVVLYWFEFIGEILNLKLEAEDDSDDDDGCGDDNDENEEAAQETFVIQIVFCDLRRTDDSWSID